MRTLPAGTIEVVPDEPAPPGDERAARIAQAIATGRRAFVQADAPADALARAVWSALPMRARRRASVATWAFGNGNRFDLVALPRLAGVEFDNSYRDARDLECPPAPSGTSRRVPPAACPPVADSASTGGQAAGGTRRIIAAIGAVSLAVALGLAFRPRGEESRAPHPPPRSRPGPDRGGAPRPGRLCGRSARPG